MTPDTPNPSEIVTSIELTAKELCAELRLPPRRYWMDKAADLIEHLQRELAAANARIAELQQFHDWAAPQCVDHSEQQDTIAAQQARIAEAQSILLEVTGLRVCCMNIPPIDRTFARVAAWLASTPAGSKENDND